MIKRILLIISLAAAYSYAMQPDKAVETIKQQQIPAEKKWFVDAELSGNGYLRLISTSKFFEASQKKQKKTLERIASKWYSYIDFSQASTMAFIEVEGPSYSSLWRCADTATKTMQHIDTRNLYDSNSINSPKATGRLYMYFGGQYYMNYLMENKQLELGLTGSLRFGSYFYKNMFDVSLMYNSGVVLQLVSSDDGQNTDRTITSSSYGCMARVHSPWPLFKIVYPNVGGQWLHSSATGEASSSAVGGVGIRVYGGILDISASRGVVSAGWTVLF